MQHAFQDGYSILSVKGKVVTLEYYYINTVARETKMEYQAVYNVTALKGGAGQLSQLYVARFVSSSTGSGIGEHIRAIYLEPALLNNELIKNKLVGQYVFSGHGYSYDWNLCYLNK